MEMHVQPTTQMGQSFSCILPLRAGYSKKYWKSYMVKHEREGLGFSRMGLVRPQYLNNFG